MEDFVNEGLLGAGTCSAVYKMRHRSKPNIVMAVKHMRRSSTCQEENKRILMDLTVVTKSYDCAYIVECFGIFFTSGDVWICMEVMSTCLDKLLHELHRPFPERVLGKITVAITTALDYLKRKHNVMHRDVKPSNMLLSYQGVIKLCDFGISGKLKDSIARSRQLGCIGYMAPERLETATYDVRADIWSLGISLVELATGMFPYTGTEIEFAIMSKIISEPAPSLPYHIPFSQAFRQFVDWCLRKDYKQRPKYRFLMGTEFFRRYDIEPHDVLEWIQGLPLPYLHLPVESSPNTSQSSASINPSSVSSTIPVKPTISSPASTKTLTPDVLPDLGKNSPKNYQGKMGVGPNGSVSGGFSVSVVAAPSMGPNRKSEGLLGVHSAAGNVQAARESNSGIQNETDLRWNSDYSGPNRKNGGASGISEQLQSTLVKGLRDTQSQFSSGYGSAGSDSSPSSFCSESRSTSATQISDYVSSSGTGCSSPTSISLSTNCNEAKPPVARYVSPVLAKTICNLRNPSTDSATCPSISHRTDSSSSPGSDHWITSSSSRTTHHVTTPQATSTVAPLVRKFEEKPDCRAVDNGFADDPRKTAHSRDMALVDSAAAPDNPATLASHRKTQVTQKISVQPRSSSVGPRLQRSPAQRWPLRPVDECSDLPPWSQTKVTSSKRSAVYELTIPDPRQYSHVQLVPSPTVPRSVAERSAPSPQQYHHHYFHYYDQPLYPPFSSFATRSMTPPLPLTRPDLVPNTLYEPYRNKCGTNTLPCRSEQRIGPTPLLSGRLAQRLYTHPLPHQSNHLNVVAPRTYARQPKTNPRVPRHPRSTRPSDSSQPTFPTGSVDRLDACQPFNSTCCKHECSPLKDDRPTNQIKTATESIPNRQLQRSSSQPPKGHELLSFETEL
ncbi:unnamed protein product [Calicophoron daubneyi]